MDQVKKQLAVVLQYGFWIVSGIVLLGSVGIWYKTTSDLYKENEDQIRKLDQAVQTVNTLRGELDTHPNEKSAEETQLLIDKRQAEVLEAWRRSYERQRRLLTWDASELTEAFVKEFRDLIPIEAYVEFPIEQDKEPTLLNIYRYYIGNVLPKIAAIAKTEWTANFDKKAGAPATRTAGPSRPAADLIGAADDGPLVIWSAASQEALLKDLFPWRGRRPNSLEIYYSQENIWILKQLLEIISNVNGDATQAFEAKIRQINSIGIGRSVKFGTGTISEPGAVSAAAGMSMMGMEMEESSMMAGMDDMTTATFDDVDPGDNRYVDTENQPITGAALRSALQSNSPGDASIAVAKRVPVMMSVQIDQRYIQRLLAECGNAALMVDIQHVRILPKDAGKGGGGGMSPGGGMEEEMDMSEMDMGLGMTPTGGASQSRSTAALPKEEHPFDMTVEIYGLIYIYNPPQKEKLGVEQVDENFEIDGVKMGEKANEATEDALPAPTATPAPGTPAPATTAPATTAPATTAPGTTAPGTTTPAAPDASTPDASPDTGTPDATTTDAAPTPAPDAATPDATQPDATQPDATQPDPAATQPAPPAAGTPAPPTAISTGL